MTSNLNLFQRNQISHSYVTLTNWLFPMSISVYISFKSSVFWMENTFSDVTSKITHTIHNFLLSWSRWKLSLIKCKSKEKCEDKKDPFPKTGLKFSKGETNDEKEDSNSLLSGVISLSQCLDSAFLWFH